MQDSNKSVEEILAEVAKERGHITSKETQRGHLDPPVNSFAIDHLTDDEDEHHHHQQQHQLQQNGSDMHAANGGHLSAHIGRHTSDGSGHGSLHIDMLSKEGKV